MKILKKILDLWNVYGGILISVFLGWLFNFNQKYMDTTTSFLLMTITICSILTLLKKHLKHNLSPFEKATLNQRTIKVVDITTNSENYSEELNHNIVITLTLMERIRIKMLKFLKTYKGLITSALIMIFNIIEELTGFMNTITNNIFVIEKLGNIDVLNVLLYLIAVVIAGLSYGLGSPEFKEAIAKVKDQLDGDKTENIALIKDKKYLEKQVLIYQKKLDKLEKDNKQLLEDFNRNKRLGLVIDSDMQNNHTKFLSEKNKLNAIIEAYKKKINEFV